MSSPLKNLFCSLKFSTREIRAVLLLLALLVFVVIIVVEAIKLDSSDVDLNDAEALDVEVRTDLPVPEHTLTEFDPNTVSYEELRALGLDPKVAVSLVKYRAAGKIFTIPEDVATCYGITDSIYAVLKPYIVIGNQYKLKHSVLDADPSMTHPEDSRHRDSRILKTPLTEFDPNKLDIAGFMSLGFSEAQSRSIINFRNALGKFHSPEEFSRAYAVSPQTFEQLRPFIVIDSVEESVDFGLQPEPVRSSTVELNTADSITLLSIRGIGPKTAAAIIAYRKRLGGYASADQILETGIVSEHNWDLIRKQIYVDSCIIHKIDINFAPPDSIAVHPYVSARLLRRILRNRQLKGGWNRIEDMIEDNTLTIEDARRLGAYLQFIIVSEN